MRYSLGISTEIDSACVSATKAAPCSEGCFSYRVCQGIIGQPVFHKFFTVLFVHIGVYLLLGILFKMNFHYAERDGLIPRTYNTYGELPAGKKFFDEYRLTECG